MVHRVSKPHLGALVAVVLLGGCAGDSADPLAARGFEEHTGIAAGEVDDQVCASCHADLSASYRHVAMATSISAPGPTEAAGLEYHHPASGRNYRLEQRGERVWFSRWLDGPDGSRRQLLELPVDFVVGSGAHARSYVVRMADDELFLLPVTWYRDEGLRMSPGFDRRDHLGVLRQVRRDCLVCHAAKPELEVGGDLPRAPERFPPTLAPIGCQRCHGAGAEHARLAFLGQTERARAALVDLGALTPERQLAVCDSCHLQPSVALSATRRFDRGEYAFEAGMGLGEHRVAAAVHQRGRELGDDFEINHHAWRLRQSACFEASAGRPVCTDCHDPHRKEEPVAFAARVRHACGVCHDAAHGCTEPAGRAANADCASCHMPRRRPDDVVRVVMTDHRISRLPPVDRLTPRAERELEIERMSFPHWGGRPPGAEGAALLAVSALRATGYRNSSALEALRAAALELTPTSREVQYELARAELAAGDAGAARAAIELALVRDPQDLAALEVLGLIEASVQRYSEAKLALTQVLTADPRRAGAWETLGMVELGREDPAAAAVALEQAVRWRDLAPSAWVRLGQARYQLGSIEQAAVAWERALVIEPRTTAAWLALAQLAQEQDDRARARELLEQAALLVDDTDAGLVLAHLQRLEGRSREPQD